MTRPTSIECHPSGTFFDFSAPTPEMIHIEDIARALSLQCRFGGHARRFYSVAEHALLVSRLVREAGHGPDLQFAALHHDSAEAYLGDVTKPLKNLLGVKYPRLTVAVDNAIRERFGMDWPLLDDPAVKAADDEAMFIEASVLKVSRGIGPQWGHDRTAPPAMPHGAVACWSPEWAEGMFLVTHRRLSAAAAVVA